MSFDKYEYEYTGKAVTPVLTITYAGKTLKQGTDYTVAFSNNINPGYATAKITGKGNFTGTKNSYFYINKKNGSEEKPNPSDEEDDDKKSSEEANDGQNSGSSKADPQTATKLKDDGKSAILGHVVYIVNGSNVVVSDFDGNITSFTAPQNVTIAGRSYKVTAIGSYAFSNLKSLKKVDLSKSEITKIGSNAFSGCSKLKTIKLNADMQKTVSNNAFKNVSAKAKCTIISKDKKACKKLMKKLKKTGLKKASFKMKNH